MKVPIKSGNCGADLLPNHRVGLVLYEMKPSHLQACKWPLGKTSEIFLMSESEAKRPTCIWMHHPGPNHIVLRLCGVHSLCYYSYYYYCCCYREIGHDPSYRSTATNEKIGFI